MTTLNKQSLHPTTHDERHTWQMTLSNALIITRREVRDSFRDWRIIAPIIVLTFFFPFLAQFAAELIANFLARYGAEYIGGQFIPFLLMVVGFFPISISLVIALETFVGEKERRSLEPLLSTPLTNTELYIGKALSSMIPPLVASFLGMSFYLFTLYISGSPWQPTPVLTLQIYLLTIVQALVMVTGAVVVSSQTTSTRAANLLASVIIIPMTLIVNAESIIIFLAPDATSPRGIGALWAIMVAMVIVVVLLLRVGTSIFNREELLGRSIDTLNIVGIFRKIGQYFLAVDAEGTRAANLVAWYRRGIPHSLRNLRTPLLVTTGVFTGFFILGSVIGTLPQFQIPLSGFNPQNLPADALSQVSETGIGVGFILTQNIRVTLFAGMLAAISFGVAAYILIPPTFLILGYALTQLVNAGLTGLFFVAVLPHGIIEIPIIALATAAVFRIGATVTRPPAGNTVGHAWLVAIGEALKIFVGVVVPGLIIAALIEVYVTFPLVGWYTQNVAF